MFACTVALPPPETLQEVSVPIVSASTCREAYSTLTDNMLCAGLTEGGKDSCQVSGLRKLGGRGMGGAQARAVLTPAGQEGYSRVLCCVALRRVVLLMASCLVIFL